MKIIAVQCLSTLIASCSRAFLFFPSFTLSPSFLSSLFFLTFPLTFLLSASIPILSTPPSFPTPNPYNLSISSSTSLLSIPPFLVCLLPIQPLLSFLPLFFCLSLLSILPFHSFLSLLPITPLYFFISLLFFPSLLSLFATFPSSLSFLSSPSSHFFPTTPSLPSPLFFPTPPFLPFISLCSFLPLLYFHLPLSFPHSFSPLLPSSFHCSHSLLLPIIILLCSPSLPPTHPTERFLSLSLLFFYPFHFYPLLLPHFPPSLLPALPSLSRVLNIIQYFIILHRWLLLYSIL